MAKRKAGAKPAPKNLPDLNKMLQESRAKKKAETLAEKVFGKKGQESRGPSFQKAKAVGASLASRAGVTKQRPQNPSQTSRQTDLTFRASTLPRRTIPPTRQNDRRIVSLQRHLNGYASDSSAPAAAPRQVNIASQPVSVNGRGISVRGMGERITIMAQNFAPGTTGGDIRAVLGPDIEAALLRCAIVAKHPTVIAEMVFDSRDAAETVVKKYNNQKADGRVLHVYEIQPHNIGPAQRSQNRPLAAQDTMDVDDGYDGYADGTRAYSEPRRTHSDYQDGRYGFGSDARESSYDQDRSSYDRERLDRRGGRVSNDRPADQQYSNGFRR